jgi:hypothetical protein
MLLLLSACDGTSPKPSTDPDADDTATSAGDTDADTDVDSTLACADVVWPDRTVATATCPDTPADWTLQEVWRWTDASGATPVPTLHTGRFIDTDGDGLTTVADDMEMWVTPYTAYEMSAPHVLLGPAGDVLRAETAWDGAYGLAATVGELEADHPGMEYAVASYIYRGTSSFTVSDESDRLYSFDLGVAEGGLPFLLDVDRDGAPEVLQSTLVYAAADGDQIGRLYDGRNFENVAADLDMDGFPEILNVTYDGVGIWGADATLRAVCPVPIRADDAYATFAIGNLDSDPEGEIVAATHGWLSVCEADGTLVASVETDSAAGALVGLGELDGDPLPEIVIDYNRAGSGGIAAYDTDLTPLWERDGAQDYWSPFALADLDGDGLHEIVVENGPTLTILDATGAVLAETAGPQPGGWLTAPQIVDIDGDDLAEIVAVGTDPTVLVVENAAGGWRARGVSDPWPGLDHFPGDRAVDGSLPDPADVAWARDGENVWQGLPAGPPTYPDLGVTIESACTDDCADILFTVYVANAGETSTAEPVGVTLSRVDDGVVLASTTVAAPLAAGASVPVRFRVATSDAGTGVRADVNEGGAIAECAGLADEAELFDLPCR